MPRLFSRLRERALSLKTQTMALYLACRHPRTPWYAKLVAAAVVAYALSPIDLIPDFIPVLGYLDDLLLVPAGILLAVRLIPKDVMASCTNEAGQRLQKGAAGGRAAAAAVVSVWLAALAFAAWLVLKTVK